MLRLSHGQIIARVERGMDRLEQSRREVEVARWLTAEGLPVTRPLDVEQPFVVGGTVVSLWHAVDGEWTVPAELGRLLRKLHGLRPPAELSLPALDPFSRVDERIEAVQGIPDEDKAQLRTLARDLRGALQEVEYVLPTAVIHGDANIGNVLRTPEGEAVLFDLDGVCWGPPEWDLAITAVYRELGWHTDAEYEEFCQAYGFDVTQLPGYPVLRAVRELRMTCWLSQQAGDDESIAAEVSRRIQDLADPARPRLWHPY
ncbi:aminoglycoside phosphotransferase family protein [Actinomadura barringtoniae]|uniref:Aminoglycoside phosphotransferase family protein n=1 Tax=Actinomadura barringtoniae TaxID=1427535 RepID=A0A939P887_9ACTN|nr:aminoglycoside phosphotransferase family protein [Actinomadura barringtoniae]